MNCRNFVVMVAAWWLGIDIAQSAAQELVPVAGKKRDTWSGLEILPPPTGLQDENPDTQALEETSGKSEIIRQRYPDGKTQIKRQVIQDESGNYYNHGPWQLFNQRGQVMAEGQFDMGRMNETWKRWHPAGSLGLFEESPFNEYSGPFLSVATFANGRLDGSWTIFDENRRKILEIPYENGRRHGTALWYWPNGVKMRQVTFEAGQLHGQLLQWNKTEQVTRQESYENGRELITRTSWYHRNQKQSQDHFLGAEMRFEGDDDWWNAVPTTYQIVGQEIQHGPSIAWYPNGQIQYKGQYQDGERTGPFVWWHETGQKQIAGSFRRGLKHGRWSWWHENGIKAIEGNYTDDVAQGIWTWWTAAGEVERQEDLSNPSAEGEIETIDPDFFEDID